MYFIIMSHCSFSHSQISFSSSQIFENHLRDIYRNLGRVAPTRPHLLSTQKEVKRHVVAASGAMQPRYNVLYKSILELSL